MQAWNIFKKQSIWKIRSAWKTKIRPPSDKNFLFARIGNRGSDNSARIFALSSVSAVSFLVLLNEVNFTSVSYSEEVKKPEPSVETSHNEQDNRMNIKTFYEASKVEDTYSSICGCAQYAANNPVEDRYYLEKMANGGWWFSVFDGHGGWQCSEYAHKTLNKNFETELNNYLGIYPNRQAPNRNAFASLFESAVDDAQTRSLYEGKISSKIIKKALEAAFLRTDRQFMGKMAGAFEMGFGRDTRAGSCAIAVFVMDGVLFCANAGDCRAVIARKEPKNKLKNMESKEIIDTRNKRKALYPQEKVDISPLDDELLKEAVNQSVGVEGDPLAQQKLRQHLIKKLSDEKEQKLSREEVEALQLRNYESNFQDVGNDDGSTSRFVNIISFLSGSNAKKKETYRKYPVLPSSETVIVAKDLSTDHNCKHKREQEKLRVEHPKETDVVVCKNKNSCYVKGRLQPTRSLGDFHLKFSEFKIPSRTRIQSVHDNPFTPPYITATPEIQLLKLTENRDEIVVLASDGLWDYLSSQEVVEHVHKSLREEKRSPKEASELLVEEVLKAAAKKHGLKVEDLKSLKPGRTRRTKHDDITVLVIDMASLLQQYYWG
eukprot:maker-scaffold_7-snap-gene-6.39-mRNA-1 protein AED:0.01 eAED:0.01 QI:183/1/1/1/1/1/4/328/601